jgi:hypothetical protein
MGYGLWVGLGVELVRGRVWVRIRGQGEGRGLGQD